MTAVTDACVLLSNYFTLLVFNNCTAGQKQIIIIYLYYSAVLANATDIILL